MSKRISLLFILAWGISLALIAFPNHQVNSQDSNWLSSPVQGANRCGYPWGGSNPSGNQAFHNAVDLACGMDGAEVLAVADGEVVYVDWWPKWTQASGNGHGQIVAIYHPANGVYTYYAHLKDTTVPVGKKVSKGEVIGHVGQTGYANHNSHLHFSTATKDPVAMEQANCWTRSCWPNPDNYLGKATSTSSQESQQPAENNNNVQENSNSQVSEEPYVPEGYTLEAGLVTKKVSFNIGFLEQFVITFAPYRTFVILALALVAIFWAGGMIYSTQFRRSMTAFAVVAAVVIFFFIGVNQVSANSSIFSPPRNSEYSVHTSSSEDWSVQKSEENQNNGGNEEKNNPPSTYDGTCHLSSSYPQSILRWCDSIERWAAKRNMDPNWIAAVMLQESGGDPEILSSSGAVGLLQVMPRDGIAATFHNSQGVPYFSDRPSIAELKNPDFNIEYGSGMLMDLGINSDPREALLHYGPRPDDLERTYGSRYYYADLVISIYHSHQ